ncbi:MAG: PDZ domain-containing protein [Planctomycetota bacterium]
MNKIYNSFIRARKNPLVFFDIFGRYNTLSEIISQIFIDSQQEGIYIPYGLNFFQLGSRLLILNQGRVKGFFDDDRGWLGIKYNPYDDAPYVRVLGILPGTPAEKYGLQDDDKILEIDNFKIPPNPKKMQSFAYRIWSKLPAQKVLLKINRDEKTFTKLIKLASPPVNSGDRIRWLRFYHNFLIIERVNRLNIIDVEKAKKVWRFPPNFNFTPGDMVVSTMDDKYAYLLISTRLNLKNIENRDFLTKKEHTYFAKISLATLQFEILKFLKLKKGWEIGSMFCEENLCFILVREDTRIVIAVINTQTGRKIKNIPTSLKIESYPQYNEASLKNYRFIFLSGRKTTCIVRESAWRPELLNVDGIFCFNKNRKKFDVNKNILKWSKKISMIIGYSSKNILLRHFNNGIFLFNLDTAKLYNLKLAINSDQIYKNLYHSLPNGFVLNK